MCNSSSKIFESLGCNNKIPDDRAPKIKYFNPDSEDFKESRFIAAITYKVKLWSSIPRYIAIKLLEAINNNIPKVENKINIGISKKTNFWSL